MCSLLTSPTYTPAPSSSIWTNSILVILLFLRNSEFCHDWHEALKAKANTRGAVPPWTSSSFFLLTGDWDRNSRKKSKMYIVHHFQQVFSLTIFSSSRLVVLPLASCHIIQRHAITLPTSSSCICFPSLPTHRLLSSSEKSSWTLTAALMNCTYMLASRACSKQSR